MSKHIIVSNRLPIHLEKTSEGYVFQASSGGLATGLKSFHSEGDALWIGWPGIASEALSQSEVIQLEEELKTGRYAPVFLTEPEIDDFYYGLSNKCLWPLFHYFSHLMVFEENQWDAYEAVNLKYAEIVNQYLEPGDYVWVHDYQLMLCPQMIRDLNPEVTIGFFLHIPFPSFELYRIFPKRKELLEGLLGADLIGFHTYDYQRHFLSSVKRILNLEVTFNEILKDHREVTVNTFPMGIDFDKFDGAAKTHGKLPSKEQSDISLQLEMHKKQSEKSHLILAIDRLDYTKGITNRIKAFEIFLEQFPEYLEKVRLIMLAVPSRTSVSHYQALKRETDELVGRVNGRFATVNWTPIWYYYRSMEFDNLIDLYLAADIAMITPVRDGMNLVAKEYLATRVDDTGVLILSEMAGAAKELHQAILVNPYDLEELAGAIKTAVDMPLKEQIERNKGLRKRIRRYTVHKWAASFIKALKSVAQHDRKKQKTLSNEKVIQHLLERFEQSSNRLLLLDYDGTLVGFHNDPAQSLPDSTLLELLQQLTALPHTKVVIISGRDGQFLDAQFGHLNMGLVAEHGLSIKRAGGEWIHNDLAHNEWMDTILPILETFSDNTPGTFIERKNNSLVWHYRQTDPELGSQRAIELKTLLDSIITGEIEYMDGDKIIEVVNRNINKGVAATSLIQNEEYDFILAAGDDVTDERMFAALPQRAITIKVGKKATEATYMASSSQKFKSFLNLLTDI